MRRDAGVSKAIHFAGCVLVLIAVFVISAFLTPTARLQESASEAAIAPVSSLQKSEESLFVKEKGDQVVVDAAPQMNPQLVTVTSYPFSSTTAVALEDMTSGTTQLVAASTDDNNSALASIGFDFWFDGVRFTQFGVNGNGFARLGAASTGTSFTNSIATTTNAPKIMPFWDDLCVGTNGKVHFKTIGSAPDRKLVVEFQNMQITRGAGCAGAGGGTFQMWLFETTGVIEFVYGAGMVATAAVDGGYSIGLQSGAATNFASVTAATNTVSYAAANNTQTTAITAGTAYLFTPQTATAPSGVNFTGTTAVATTLNWTDNSSNEVGFVVYRSTDFGLSFTFVAQTAANVTTLAEAGLSPSTTYTYRVYALTEGSLGTPDQNSVTTNAPGSASSTAAGGNWSNSATWVGGVVPTAVDTVTIVDGSTVTIDTAAVAFQVQVGTGGAASVLQFEPTTARTLAVGNSLSIASNGTLQSASAGTQTGHVVSVGGIGLQNGGVLDLSTNGNTAGAALTFTGSGNATLSGTGPTTDVRTITVNKGTSSTPTVEVTASNFTVQGVTTDVAGFLTLTNGTFKISSTFTMTNRIFPTANYTIPATAGLWLNNPNFTVPGQAGGTTSANNGLFRMTQGIYGIGVSGADGLGGGAGAVFIIEGGTINATRIDPQNAVSWTQTGGTINVGLVANTRSNFGTFELFSATATYTMSGGTINLVQAAVAATPIDYQVLATPTITGGTLNVGTAATTTNFNFRIRGQVPSMVVDNTINNKTATYTGQTNTFGNVTINAGTTINTGSFVWVVIGPSVTNNGTITVPTNLSRFYFLGTGPQTYTGNGTCTIIAASGSVDLTMDNPAGLTIDPASGGIVTQRVNFFRGNITNSNKLTLGNAGATVGVIQYGLAGGLNTAGNFDVAPVFSIGTGGQTVLYAQEPTPRTTGVEIPPSRTITNSTINNTNGVIIGGGDLTLAPTIATSVLTLTVGNITTPNTLILSPATTVARTSGHVIGNLRKTYAAAGSKTFEVGTANGFSPMTVNATAGTFPADFTVKATQGPQPGVDPATSIQRYWTLTGSGITADLSFQYLAADVLGTEANYKMIRVSGGTSVAFPGSVVTPATHVATLASVSSFSDWTVGEITSPTAAPATIRGVVTRADGSPVGGVTVNLTGGRLNAGARTITGANGEYRFENVETDGLYVVRPGLANYSFNPASRAFTLLANKTDAAFTATANATPTENPLNGGDFFVRQQYLDFLGREPEAQGWLFWTGQLSSCGVDQNCIRQKRIDISAAFFASEEFQQSGNYVYRLYRAGLGRQLTYAEFTEDHKKVIGGADLESLRTQFADSFVQRQGFVEKYQNAVLAETFVDALLQGMLSDRQVDLSSRRAELIATYNNNSDLDHSRSAVLKAVAERKEYKTAVYNPSVVLMEYFGYLQRDMDQDGFAFWVNVLNSGDPGNYRGMVCSFLTSAEYQRRFSSVVTHSNAECGR